MPIPRVVYITDQSIVQPVSFFLQPSIQSELSQSDDTHNPTLHGMSSPKDSHRKRKHKQLSTDIPPAFKQGSHEITKKSLTLQYLQCDSEIQRS